jgi:hypothetical protein
VTVYVAAGWFVGMLAFAGVYAGVLALLDRRRKRG